MSEIGYHRIKATVVGMTKIDCTSNGNPMWELELVYHCNLNDCDFSTVVRTAPDVMFAYELHAGWLDRRVIATYKPLKSFNRLYHIKLA